jgi:proton-dependent oligopeptide transporter, POT family
MFSSSTFQSKGNAATLTISVFNRGQEAAKDAMSDPHVKNHNMGQNHMKATIQNPIVYIIFLVEVAERFAYYGFRAILILYLIRSLQYSETTAIALYGYNSSLSYFTPLLGAYLADDCIGRYRTILSLGALYAVGLLLLTGATQISAALLWKRMMSFLGLFLICLGTGGIKPCVSSFGADQLSGPTFDSATSEDVSGREMVSVEEDRDPFQTGGGAITSSEREPMPRDEDSEELRVYFNYFYFCINFGALTSIAIIPLVREYAGFTMAFAVPFGCMILALVVFWSQRSRYVHQPAQKDSDAGILRTFQAVGHLVIQKIQSRYPSWAASQSCHCICRQYTSFQVGIIRSHKSSEDFDESESGNDAAPQRGTGFMEDAVQILHILPIFAMFPIYSCLYDQQGSVWTLQATHMYLPWNMQPEQMNMINPVLIMILIPLFDRIIYPFLHRYTSIPPLRLMSWGMFLTALAFSCSGFVETAIQSHEKDEASSKVHVLWQLPQIVLLAVGEIFLSVTGLEFSYAQSPVRFKAFVSALYLSTTGMGDLLAGLLYSTIFSLMNRAVVMHVCAVMMLVNLRVFLWVAHWYDHRLLHLHSYSKFEASGALEMKSFDHEID